MNITELTPHDYSEAYQNALALPSMLPMTDMHASQVFWFQFYNETKETITLTISVREIKFWEGPVEPGETKSLIPHDDRPFPFRLGEWRVKADKQGLRWSIGAERYAHDPLPTLPVRTGEYISD